MDPAPRPARTPLPRRAPAHRERAFHFSAGEVLATSFRIFGRHLPILVLLAAAFHAVPTALEFVRAQVVADDVREAIAAREMPGFFVLMGGPLGLATMLASWVLPIAFQAVVTLAVFKTLGGGSPRYGESVGKGVQRLLPALGAAFFVALAIGLPMFIITLVLGGIGGVGGALFGLLGGLVYATIMACTWYVAIQVAVVEGADPFKSMQRSARLTSRARGSIFGIVLLVYVLPAVLVAVIQHFFLARPDPRVVDPARILVQTGFGVFFGGLQAVTSVVVYHALRSAKEGVGLDELLKVFD